MVRRGLCLILALGFAGASQLGAQDQLGAQESMNADSLPVVQRYRYWERKVTAEFSLTTPGYLAVFDISADDVEVVSSKHGAALPAGPHKLTLPRPRQFSGWSPLPRPSGPCTEAVPMGPGGGIRYVYTGVCGFGSHISGNRAAAMSGTPPRIPAVVDTFLVVVLPSPRSDQEIKTIAGMADHEEDRAHSILKALGAREEGVRWAVVVVR